jgi:hypothetical protein
MFADGLRRGGFAGAAAAKAPVGKEKSPDGRESLENRRSQASRGALHTLAERGMGAYAPAR